MKRPDPRVGIECMHFRTTGRWCWAFVELDGIHVTSGYCRSKEVAVRQLKRKLRKIEHDLEFAKGFLGGFGC